MRSHNLSYTVEEFHFAGDWLTLELDLEYTLDPYDPGCGPSYASGGEPPSGGGVADLACKITSVLNGDGHLLSGSYEEIQGEFDSRFEKEYQDKIDTYIHEHHEEEEPDYDV